MSGAVNTPDRTFVDDLGRQWEWCGGEAGTWAWRITRLSQAVMSGDVGARARELLAAYEDGYPVNTCGKHTGRASNRCLLPAEHEGPHDDDPPPFTFPNDLAAELVEELEMQTSLQGLSVKIPEYGEWGSETLLYLFQDFGIQPGDGYQAASSRQGDLLRSLAAANAEVEKLRRGGKALGRMIELQNRDVLNITGLHHLIGPDGDGDWGAVWERLAEMAAAGAEVEKLRGAMDNHQATIFQIQEARVDYNAALNRREHGAVAADHFMRNVFSALDIHAAVIERAGIEP